MNCKPIDVKFSAHKESLEATFKDVGVKGASAYEIAVMRGFQGTVDEWLESLHGEDGKPGTPGKDGKPFTYDDFTEEQLQALTGPVGPAGKDGKDGLPGKDGQDGQPGKDGAPGRDGKDGQPGEPGKDGQPGQPGKDGKDGAPGQPGADGYTPVRGIDYWTETDKEEIVEEVLEKVPSGGGGAAIIDVIALPAEKIDEDSFYRLLTGTFVYNQYTQNGMICYCVDSLPETGEPVVSGDLSNLENATITAYYNTQDGSVSAYVTAMLSGVFGVPAGWYPAAVLMNAVGVTFSGVITNIMDDPRDNTYRLLLEYVVYSYKDGWTSLKPIGKAGTGNGAEVFNHPSNQALGKVSHAEGRFTVAGRPAAEDPYNYGAHAEGMETKAYGSASHAEGYYSHAEGYSSHAEGYYSHAEGYSSHAEGDSSHAEGGSSHAEGYYSHAEGHFSHAEGYSSHAAGRSQHVQGEHNIVDPEYDANDPEKRGKYAHIVGNGTSENNRSNAHTLDWEGNAWFAGTVEGTALILKSPGVKRFQITVDDNGNLSATAV